MNGTNIVTVFGWLNRRQKCHKIKTMRNTKQKKITWHIARKRERIVMCHRKCATFGTTNGMKIDDNIMHDNDNQILFDFWYYTIWCTMFSEWVSVCNIWRGGFLRGTRMNTNNEWSNRFVEEKTKQKELVWQPNHNWCSNLTFNPDIKTFEHSTDFWFFNATIYIK